MPIDYTFYPYYFSFDEIGVPNFCTTRQAGISLWPYSSCNLSFATQDTPENIRENRIIISKRLNIPVDKFVYLNQIHSKKIHYAGISNCGKSLEPSNLKGDGLFTNQKGICLAVMLADCVGVILFDPEKYAIGTCHCGWKGCMLNICGKLVENMVEICGCNSEKLVAGISPSICKNCYTVGYEVVEKFPHKYSPFLFQIHNQWHIDLTGIVIYQLMEKGVIKENIHVLDICTYENTHIFYSHRAEKNTGRFLFGIYLPE